MLTVGGALVAVAVTLGRVGRFAGDDVHYVALALIVPGLVLLLGGAIMRWQARTR